MNIEDLKVAREKLAVAADTNISHAELGPVNDFSEAEKFKNAMCEKLIDVIDTTLKIAEVGEDLLLPHGVEQQLKSMAEWCENQIAAINSAVGQAGGGVHTPDFPSRRKQLIGYFENWISSFSHQLNPIYHGIQIWKLSQSQPDLSEIRSKKEELDRELAGVDEQVKETQRLLDSLKSQYEQKAVLKSHSTFTALSSIHARLAKLWFVGIVAGFLGIAGVIVWAALSGYPEVNTENQAYVYLQILPQMLTKVLAVAVASVVLKVSLSKFNAERGLSILYAHRTTVLEIFNTYQESVDPSERKDLRLELARIVFSDPRTTFLADVSSNDTNINPIINMPDVLTKISRPG